MLMAAFACYVLLFSTILYLNTAICSQTDLLKHACSRFTEYDSLQHGVFIEHDLAL